MAETKQQASSIDNHDARDGVSAMLPADLVETLLTIGHAEWGATAPATAEEHAAMTLNSVNITAENFGQSEPQPMNGLYVVGTETIICHTGTSPNSANIARAMTGAWNHLVDLARAQAALQKEDSSHVG